MNERYTERTTTTTGTVDEDETTRGTRTQQTVGAPDAGEMTTAEHATGGRPTGSTSTAEMAEAMDRSGTGGTREAVAAMARHGNSSDGTATTADVQDEPLFAGDEAEAFRSRWTSIQAGFVDEPRQAVEQADELVAEVIQRLAQVFADERSTLEQQWSQGDSVDTEGLRVALRRYRSFFERLLSA